MRTDDRSVFTVMVVEDSADTRRVLSLSLLEQGYRVITAANGREAVEMSRRQCPDLILMDLNLPLMDGLAAVEQIRGSGGPCKDVPILAVTAYDTYGMEDAALEVGCDAYIRKPLDFEQLHDTVAQMLNCLEPPAYARKSRGPSDVRPAVVRPRVRSERRKKERFTAPVPVLLRGVSSEGERFEHEGVLENVSVGGFYLRLSRSVEPGASVFALIRFTAGLPARGRGPAFAAVGRVLRVEPCPGGGLGTAVAITRHRFL